MSFILRRCGRALSTAALCLQLLLAACASSPPPATLSGQKLLVIGLSGADWRRMEPMMEQGRLPHLGALARSGAMGRVMVNGPTVSPLLWTTVATGHYADVHGILDVAEMDVQGGQAPVSSRSRQVRALWDMVADAGLETATLGWWATTPVEAVPGIVVADGWAQLSALATEMETSESGDSGAALIRPAGLTAEIEPLGVSAWDVEPLELSRFVPLRDEERKILAGASEGYGLADEHPLLALRRAVAVTASLEAATEHILQTQAPDLTMVFFESLDVVGRSFSRYEAPAMAGVSAAEQRRYAGVNDAFYRYMDEVVGRLVAAAPPGAAIAVVSGHGLARGASRPEEDPLNAGGQAALWHDGPGTLLLAGTPFSQTRLGDVRLVDVVPTLLAVMGLPVAEDMPGGPLLAAFASDFLATHPVRAIASHEEGRRGLVRAGGAQRPQMTPAARFNLAESMAGRGDVPGARDAFEVALAETPDSSLAHGALFELLLKHGAPKDAVAAGERMLAQAAAPSAAAYEQVAALWVELDRVTAGRDFLEQYPGKAGGPGPWLARAVLDEAEGQDDAAREALERALERAPASWDVARSVLAFHERRGTVREAIPALRRGLAARSGHSLPHLVALGYVELTADNLEGAGDYLGRAVEIAPDQREALLYLGSVHYRAGRYRDAARTWSHLVEVEPEHRDARVNLILALGRIGRIAQALEVFRGAGPAGRLSPDLLNAAAWACLVNGLAEEGLPLARRSLELDEDHPGTAGLLRALENPDADVPPVATP